MTEDVNFANPKNLVVVSNVDSTTGEPTKYAIRAYGQVVSGRTNIKNVRVQNYQKFHRIDLGSEEITEVVSVVDSSGNRYFEVENLSQNVVYRPIVNTGVDSDTVPNLFRPFVVIRRYVIERELGRTFLQFGYGSEDNLSNEGFLNPDDIALQRHGREHITDFSFDPTKLLQSDKFGVSPSNTILQVMYRVNDRTNINAAASSVTKVGSAIFQFKNESSVNNASKPDITKSLEVINDEPIIGDLSYPSGDEIKRRIFDVFTSQNRAVTEQDYKALIYLMPNKFGSLKRCAITQDPDAFKRNLNIHVVSEDSSGNLVKTNGTIKNNLKIWLNQYRMINDTIDILDPFIINLGIDFVAQATPNANKHEVLEECISALKRKFETKFYIGEHLNISEVYKELNKIDSVVDVALVQIVPKIGTNYSSNSILINKNMSPNGTKLICPKNAIFEIKFPDVDFTGNIR